MLLNLSAENEDLQMLLNFSAENKDLQMLLSLLLLQTLTSKCCLDLLCCKRSVMDFSSYKGGEIAQQQSLGRANELRTAANKFSPEDCPLF